MPRYSKLHTTRNSVRNRLGFESIVSYLRNRRGTKLTIDLDLGTILPIIFGPLDEQNSKRLQKYPLVRQGVQYLHLWWRTD
jgi:hypothetical protein